MKKKPLDLSGARVLVVDDVMTNLDVLFQILEEADYRVLVATDGLTALDVAGATPLEIILLDVMMPGIDGYETCRQLKARPELEDIPVIFLTARDDIEGIVEGFQAGGVDYITKPFNKDELLVRIRTHLERARFERDLEELNARLEEKVVERTHQLQLKVRELEGKDRILHHMLSFRSLEDALELVLEVVGEIVALERAVVYLQRDGEPDAAAALGYFAPGEPATPEQLEQILVTPAQRAVFADVEASGRSVSVEDTAPCAVVPIRRDDTVLGFIEVVKSAGTEPLAAAELQTLESFALQATMAINDARIRQDPDAWEDQLDEVLELDEELDDDDLLDQLHSGAVS